MRQDVLLKPHRVAERGFTLVELMVVIVILGILGATMVTMFDSDPTGEGARKLSAILQQSRRLATELGPVPTNIAVDKGTARVRVEAITRDNRNYLNVYYLSDATSDWEASDTVALPKGVQIFGLVNQAISLQGSSPPAELSPNAAVTVDFFPNGGATPQTWYLQHRTKDNAQRFRVFVMPLSGQAEVSANW